MTVIVLAVHNDDKSKSLHFEAPSCLSVDELKEAANEQIKEFYPDDKTNDFIVTIVT